MNACKVQWIGVDGSPCEAWVAKPRSEAGFVLPMMGAYPTYKAAMHAAWQVEEGHTPEIKVFDQDTIFEWEGTFMEFALANASTPDVVERVRRAQLGSVEVFGGGGASVCKVLKLGGPVPGGAS